MQSIDEIRENNGVIERLKSTLVGPETEGLRRQFAARRDALVERLESGETKSATIREARRIGRNDPCPCNSGRKFKACCGINLAADDERVAAQPGGDDAK